MDKTILEEQQAARRIAILEEEIRVHVGSVERVAEPATEQSAPQDVSGMRSLADEQAAEVARAIRVATYGPAAEAIRSRSARPEQAEAIPDDPHISAAEEEQAAARARRKTAAQREADFLASCPWNENGIPDVERVTAFYGHCGDYLYGRIALKAKAALSNQPREMRADGSYAFVF